MFSMELNHENDQDGNYRLYMVKCHKANGDYDENCVLIYHVIFIVAFIAVLLLVIVLNYYYFRKKNYMEMF